MIYKTMADPSYYVLFVNRYDSTLVHTHHVFGPDLLLYSETKAILFWARMYHVLSGGNTISYFFRL